MKRLKILFFTILCLTLLNLGNNVLGKEEVPPKEPTPINPGPLDPTSPSGEPDCHSGAQYGPCRDLFKKECFGSLGDYYGICELSQKGSAKTCYADDEFDCLL